MSDEELEAYVNGDRGLEQKKRPPRKTASGFLIKSQRNYILSGITLRECRRFLSTTFARSREA
jgi:hypothetical protein